MQIPQCSVEAHVHDLRRYVENLQNMDKPGTYLAFFAMIPKPNGKGFDIAVRKDCQGQLPDVPFLAGQPHPWQAAFLEKLDGMRVHQCMQYCDDRTGRLGPRTAQERQFAVMVQQAMFTLTQQFPPEWRNEAKFWGRPIYAHYSRPLRARSPVTTVYAFTVIGDMHASIDKSEAITRVPRTFFDARHRCYAGSPDHAVLAQDIHSAFAPLFAKKLSKPPAEPGRRRQLSDALNTITPPRDRRRRRRGGLPRKASSPTRSGSPDPSDDTSSTHELVEEPLHPSDSSRGSEKQRANHWGGILVNSETVVKTDSKTEYGGPESRGGGGDGDPAAALPMGMRCAVGTARLETTFVNELVTVTRERFLPASSRGIV
jgi:hypothetical protein